MRRETDLAARCLAAVFAGFGWPIAHLVGADVDWQGWLCALSICGPGVLMGLAGFCMSLGDLVNETTFVIDGEMLIARSTTG